MAAKTTSLIRYLRPDGDEIMFASPENSAHTINKWKLKILGGFQLSVGDKVVAIPLSGQRLVAVLALRGPSPRLQVAGILWPAAPEEKALGCLRTTMWRLRRFELAVATQPCSELALPSGVAVDAHDPAGVVWSWRDGSRYSSELLPGWYDDWVLMERERIRQVLLHASERAAEDSLAQGDPRTALTIVMTAIAVDPLRESAHRLVVRAHLAEGNIGEARRHVAHVYRLMINELGVPPSAGFCNLAHPQGAPDLPREGELVGERTSAARGMVQ